MDLSVFDAITPYQRRILTFLAHYDPSGMKWYSRLVTSLTRAAFPREHPLTHYYHRIFELDDIKHVTDGDIYLDEANLYYNSRKFAELSSEDMRLLAQHRHYGLNIYGTVQSISRVDVILRELATSVTHLSKLISIRVPFTTYSFGFHYLRYYRPATLLDSDGAGKEFYKVGFGRVFFADPSLYRLYDTRQHIATPSPIGKRELIEYTYVEVPSIKRVETGKRNLPDSTPRTI